MSTSFAIKCYVCNSRQDKRCEDPLGSLDSSNQLELQTCSVDAKQVRKQIEEVTSVLTKLGQIAPLDKKRSPWDNDSFPMACQKMEFEVVGEYIVGRGCSPARMDRYDPCESLKLIQQKDINLKFCDLCEGDGCNAGVRNQSILYGIVTLILVIAMAA